MVVCHPVIPTSTTGPSGRRVMAPDEHIGATIPVITIDQDRTGPCEGPFRRRLSSVPAVCEHVSRHTRPSPSK
jgi:hypothetical protein